MTNILAIDTATDACSVALIKNGVISERYDVIPRQHSQQFFRMLDELLDDGNLRRQEVDAIAYSSGPGSFTGLRIAASAVQGLAYSHGLPCIAVSTLACQVQTAIRRGLVTKGDTVLSLIDARIGEIYGARFEFEGDLPVLTEGPWVCKPAAALLPASKSRLVIIGSGAVHTSSIPDAGSVQIPEVHPGILPSAQDLIPFALHQFAIGDVQRPAEVAPVYVRDEINWKKLSEQGKRP